MFKQNKRKVEVITKTSEEQPSSRLNGFQRLRETGFILVVLTSILLAIALYTFNPADPSWSQTSWGSEIHNAGGLLGAWLADTLLFTFGSLAYTLPLFFTFSAWGLFRRRDEDDGIDLMIWGTRILGFTIITVTSCGIADINFDDIWYFSSGGLIGDVITSLALPTLNILGTTIVLLFFWGAGVTLLTGVSWLNIVEWIGSSVLFLLTGLVNQLRGSKETTYQPDLEHNLEPVFATDTAQASAALTGSQELEQDIGFSANQDDVDVTAKPVSRKQYNIHMPEAATEQTAPVSVDNAVQQDSPSFAQPEWTEDTTPYKQEPNLGDLDALEPESAESVNIGSHNQQVSASAQEDSAGSYALGATIEQLEQQAKSSDDFAQQEPVEVYQEPEQATTVEQPKMVDSVEMPLADAELQRQAIDETAFEPASQPEAQAVPQAAQVENAEPVFEPYQAAVENGTVVDEQAQAVEPSVQDQPVTAEPVAEDQDVEAFQQLVSDAQKNQAGQQNPFLAQRDAVLPKPEEPMPTLELLYFPEKRENFIDREALENIARLVESKLADYKIKAEVVDIFPGPVITRFELDLAPGVKVSRISGLSMDLARSLSAMAVRVVEVIPGKPYVGLELPNMSRQTVFFSDVVGSSVFQEAKSPTTIVLGQDIAGEAVIADLSKMPHVLVAGTTGSGKSVGVNVMILSMLYKATPEEVRFIMIDPKMLELSVYEGIPHLLSEVVTDMKDASNALRWCVGEMERRYKLMSALGVRNIKGFNDKLKMAAEAGHPIHDPLWQAGDSMDPEPPLLEKLPYIVVVVDEFADLMMVVGKKVEELIARLAQKARAAGVHLILATQRPSVDVITGLIKANIPTRVAFTVSTKTDSRTILDQGGAESLLGMGDMLYLPPGSSHTVRVHGAFASDDDVHAVVNNWKARGKPNYIEEITNGDASPEMLLPGEKMEGDEDVDPLFDQVVEHVVQSRRGSVSGVQRRFKIGYNRAARIVEQLEAQGIVSPPGHNGNREVLAPPPHGD
ncbi:DNA translocase FtsK [Vibrio hippocampi]|nr:DNA translocase FtsK 4TM domain-containing protein [Vibrio hippocampi]